MLAPRAALLTLALAGLSAVTGCGGGGDGGDKSEVEKVARAVLNGADKGSECRLSTVHLVTAVWGDQAACLKASSGGGSTEVKVSGTQVSGASATTTVSTMIETFKVGGTIELKKVDGDWKLDEFGNDLVRALLRDSLTAGYTESLQQKGIKGGDKLLADGTTGTCVDREIKALPASEQRQIGYAILGSRRDSAQAKQVQDVLVGCLASSGNGREALRLAFEQGIREEGLDDAVARCVIARLRVTADSRLVAREIARRQQSGGSIGPELSGLAAAAVKQCKTTKPS